MPEPEAPSITFHGPPNGYALRNELGHVMEWHLVEADAHAAATRAAGNVRVFPAWFGQPLPLPG